MSARHVVSSHVSCARSLRVHHSANANVVTKTITTNKIKQSLSMHTASCCHSLPPVVTSWPTICRWSLSDVESTSSVSRRRKSIATLPPDCELCWRTHSMREKILVTWIEPTGHTHMCPRTHRSHEKVCKMETQLHVRGRIKKILPSRGSRLATALNYLLFFSIVSLDINTR